MKIYIAVVTMGQQELIDRLFSPKFWQSVRPVVDGIYVLSQMQVVTVSNSSAPMDAPIAVSLFCEKNLGCAGARAVITQMLIENGLQRDDMIIFLDDDVEVESEYWVASLCAPLLKHYSISGVAGRNVTADYLTKETNDIEPDYVSGGWCAIRGDVFIDGCMFDEQFFPNYWEDVDLCYQARAKGKWIISVGNVGLRHEHPPTAEAAQHVSQNRKRFMEKWNKS